MLHTPIQLKDLTLSFAHKACFEAFTATIYAGTKIGIIGPNGCGKSSLLRMLTGELAPTYGNIKMPAQIQIGYVPQVIEEFPSLSGGQRFNTALHEALRIADLLLLDEPMNHLDTEQRQLLNYRLKAFTGTLVVASHDINLLNNCFDYLWCFDNGIIQVFKGSYNNWISEKNLKQSSLDDEISKLRKDQQHYHQALMQEQVRAKKSKQLGQKNIGNRKWPTLVSKAKVNRASTSQGRKQAEIVRKKQICISERAGLHLPKIIKPNFNLPSQQGNSHTIASLSTASVGYNEHPILQNISFSITKGDHVAISGKNGCGKSTLIKGILGDPSVKTTGNWQVPAPHDIGLLDQHYATLLPHLSVFDTIQARVPSWSNKRIRLHLSDFLFYRHDVVNAKVAMLSGGEKARLCLAQIATNVPKLLILDEVTNNLDLQTKQHIIEVLHNYPGAMIVISHDEDFLKSINITQHYIIQGQQLI